MNEYNGPERRAGMQKIEDALCKLDGKLDGVCTDIAVIKKDISAAAEKMKLHDKVIFGNGQKGILTRLSSAEEKIVPDVKEQISVIKTEVKPVLKLYSFITKSVWVLLIGACVLLFSFFKFLGVK